MFESWHCQNEKNIACAGRNCFLLSGEKMKEKKESNSKEKKIVGAEYSVQVMASISKDEADAALRKLKSKGVSSAFMSKRSLKGKTWYRVRFGGYSERDQAENAARKAGYTNAWVERVK